MLMPALVRGTEGFLQTEKGVPPGGQGPPLRTSDISHTHQNSLAVTVKFDVLESFWYYLLPKTWTIKMVKGNRCNEF